IFSVERENCDISPPIPDKPGFDTEPGEKISTLTPTFSWSTVTGADKYGLFIYEAPYRKDNLVYEAVAITETTHTLPSFVPILENGKKYAWNTNSHSSQCGWNSNPDSGF